MTNKKEKINIKAALTLATTALLGCTAVQAQETEEWAFDAALLYYSEVDRVSAAETIFNANKTFANDEVLSLKLTIDTLTGASAMVPLLNLMFKHLLVHQVMVNIKHRQVTRLLMIPLEIQEFSLMLNGHSH